MKRKYSIFLCALTLVLSLACEFLAGSPLKFDPESLPAARVGEAYEVKIHVSGNSTPVGGVSISKGALPAGLQLVKAEEEENTLKITGIPTEAGTFTFTVSVWCFGTNHPGDTGEKEYSLVVGE